MDKTAQRIGQAEARLDNIETPRARPGVGIIQSIEGPFNGLGSMSFTTLGATAANQIILSAINVPEQVQIEAIVAKVGASGGGQVGFAIYRGRWAPGGSALRSFKLIPQSVGQFDFGTANQRVLSNYIRPFRLDPRGSIYFIALQASAATVTILGAVTALGLVGWLQPGSNATVADWPQYIAVPPGNIVTRTPAISLLTSSVWSASQNRGMADVDTASGVNGVTGGASTQTPNEVRDVPAEITGAAAIGTSLDWMRADATVRGMSITTAQTVTGAKDFSARVALAAGSATAASLTKTGDLGTGVYFPAASQVALTTAGGAHILARLSGATRIVEFPAGTTAQIDLASAASPAGAAAPTMNMGLGANGVDGSGATPGGTGGTVITGTAGAGGAGTATALPGTGGTVQMFAGPAGTDGGFGAGTGGTASIDAGAGTRALSASDLDGTLDIGANFTTSNKTRRVRVGNANEGTSLEHFGTGPIWFGALDGAGRPAVANVFTSVHSFDPRGNIAKTTASALNVDSAAGQNVVLRPAGVAVLTAAPTVITAAQSIDPQGNIAKTTASALNLDSAAAQNVALRPAGVAVLTASSSAVTAAQSIDPQGDVAKTTASALALKAAAGQNVTLNPNNGAAVVTAASGGATVTGTATVTGAASLQSTLAVTSTSAFTGKTTHSGSVRIPDTQNVELGGAAGDLAAGGTPLTNKSGGDLVIGDLVVVDTANNLAVTTSTVAGNQRVAGPMLGAAANNATGYVAMTPGSVAKVLVKGAVVTGDFLQHSDTAKKAAAVAVPTLGNVFAIALEGGTDVAVRAVMLRF